MAASPPHTPSKATPAGNMTGAPPQHSIISSPVKASGNTIDSRRDIANSPTAQDKTIHPDFEDEHLSAIPLLLAPVGDLERYIKIISEAPHESDIYLPLCKLLNGLSERMEGHFSRLQSPSPGPQLIRFYDHHHNPLPHHPFTVGNKCDIVAAGGAEDDYTPITKDNRTDGKGVPSHKVCSMVECKPRGSNGSEKPRPQLSSYLFQMMEARPDIPGTYGLWARPAGYQVIWCDASGVIASPIASWSSTTLLVAYVYSLYYSPAGHFLRDPTVTNPVLKPGAKKHDVTSWTVSCGGKSYEGCKHMFIGSAWGRRTVVWSHEPEDGNWAVLKDSYRARGRRYEEDFLLNRVHENNTFFPGVIRLLHSEVVKDKDGEEGLPIGTVEPGDEENKDGKTPIRAKNRMVFGSRGEALLKAKTVKDLLMAVYDVLEVHRAILLKHDVLHRDMSIYNILMYPEHHKSTLEKNVASGDWKFIDDVLKPERSKSADRDKARCLLIDFDNGALTTDSTNDASTSVTKDELTSRTGTPMFIARSVARGEILSRESCLRFRHMPQLPDGPAKDAYIAAYKPAEYEAYANDELKKYVHGRPNSIDPENFYPSSYPNVKYSHRPEHDVESVFWTLLYALMQVRPRSDEVDATLPFLTSAYNLFQAHKIPGNALDGEDSRAPFLDYTKPEFSRILHPRLSSLGSMLYDMAKQITPEWAWLDPPRKDHLHEAVRRLLFKEIFAMDDPIELDPENLRPTHPPAQALPTIVDSGSQPQSTEGTKRKSTTQDGRTAGYKRTKMSSNNVLNRNRYAGGPVRR